MQHVLGIVTAVQEGRFRLTMADGIALHFTLAQPAQPKAQDLATLCTRLAHVRVAYERVEGRSALVAHEISELGMYACAPLSVLSPAPKPAPDIVLVDKRKCRLVCVQSPAA